MKNIKLVFLLLLLSFPSFGSEPKPLEAFADFNLNISMQVDGVHTYYTRSGILRQKKKHVDHFNHTLSSYLANGRYQSDANVVYDLKGDVTTGISVDAYAVEYNKAFETYNLCLARNDEIANESIKNGNYKEKEKCSDPNHDYMLESRNPNNKKFLRQLRKTDFNLSFSDQGKGSRLIKIAMTDDQNHGKEESDGRTMKFYNDSINGTINVGFRMPEATWAIVVHRKNLNGIFIGGLPNVSSTPGMVNSFNQNLKYNGKQKFIAWGKPGTDIIHQLNFNNYSQGSGLAGEIEIEFSPIDMSDIAKLSLDQIIDRIIQVTGNYKSVNTFESLIKSIKPILFLHGKNELQNTLITNKKSADILNLINALNNIVYSAEANPYHWDLKAAATILSHELALLWLKEIAPFCVEMDIYLPYSKENLKTIGLKYASFLISRAKNRLKYNTYIHFESLIKQLESYEQRNLSYSEVRSNRTEFMKLREAADLLSKTVNMRYSAYENVYSEINSIFEKFGTLSAPGIENQRVIDYSKSLRNLDVQFYSEFVESLRLFQIENKENVRTANLRATLRKLDALHNEFSMLLDERVKLSSLSNGLGYESLSKAVVSLIAHNVDILTENLGDSSFELFRSNYFDKNKVQPLIEQVNLCRGL